MPDFDPSALPRGEPQGVTPGGTLLARALRDGGVDTMFALCGGHILGLLDACPEEGIRVIDTRHEGAASLAALGWALATGRTGVAAVTAGPGFGNAMTGVMDAKLGNTPIVLIGGRTGVNQQGKGAVMDIDQRAIAAPATKWAETCRDPDRIPAFAREALWRARAGRPGPAYLEIPQDVMMRNGSPRDDTAGYPEAIPRPAPDPVSVERALGLLQRAERPIVVAGSGAFYSGCGEQLRAFAERARIPVTTISAARGVLPDSHELCLGSLVHGGVAVPQADVVLVLGSAFDANMMFGGPPLFATEQQLIQIDIDADRIGGPRAPAVALVGDCGSALEQLTSGWSGATPDHDAWLKQARSSASFGVAMWDQQIEGHRAERLHAGAVAREVAAFARETGPHTIVADGGDALTWMLAYADAEGPGRLLSTTTALGTLGVGLPFGIAAGAARPAEPVFCFVGDGSFGLCAMEFDTAVRHGIPLIVVVSNNRGWGDVQHEQDMWFGEGRQTASVLSDSAYENLAEAFGGHGERVSSFDELRPALKRSVDAGVPSIINVATDPGVLSELLRSVGKLGLM